MPELWRMAWPFLVPALLPALLLMAAPRWTPRGRRITALLLAASGLLFVADVLLIDHTAVATHQVVNLFPGADGELRHWVVAEVTGPPLHWHLFLAAMLVLAGGVVWLRRNAPPGPQRPLLLAAAVFWYYLALRLGLEANAAGPELAWAVGATPSLVVVLPFFAADLGRRGASFVRLLGGLALLAIAQRLPLIAFGYLASTRQWGTHLDTHRVTEIGGFGGPRQFGEDAVAGWTSLTLLPHLTVWIAVTVVLGVVTGLVPWLRARRSRGGAAPVLTAAAG
jgi:hypothetical protein